MMKGRKLSVAERKILKKNKISDPENYLYLKIDVVDVDGNKSTSHFRDKEKYLVVRNKETNEEKRCLCF